MHFNICPLFIFLAVVVGRIYPFSIQKSLYSLDRLFPVVLSTALNVMKCFEISNSKFGSWTNPEQEIDSKPVIMTTAYAAPRIQRQIICGIN
jgi:hypothetical protein